MYLAKLYKISRKMFQYFIKITLFVDDDYMVPHITILIKLMHMKLKSMSFVRVSIFRLFH